MLVLRTLLLVLVCSTLLRAQETAKPVPPENAPTPEPPTRAEIVRGANGPYRANNDLLYYHLEVRVDPVAKTIAGSNAVRFRMLEDGRRIQLDLTETLSVEGVTMGKQALTYTRDAGALFIDFPKTLRKGSVYTIEVRYAGAPKASGRFGGCHSRRTRRGGRGSLRLTRMMGRRSGGRPRTSGAMSRRMA